MDTENRRKKSETKRIAPGIVNLTEDVLPVHKVHKEPNRVRRLWDTLANQSHESWEDR